MVRRALVTLACGVLGTFLGAALLACAGPSSSPSDKVTAPELGACRDLDPADLDEPTNDDTPIACSQQHTAQTFAVGTLPESTGEDYHASGHGRFVYARCSEAFRKFLGADESLALRVQLSWAWFRPSRDGWQDGARWYRCDIVGGPAGADRLSPLPARLRGIFSRGEPADRWLTCARGSTLATGTKVPCSERHDWRAVTAVKVGLPEEGYPGDAVVRARSRERCSDWVGAWLHYAPDYDFAHTRFHQAEWEAGNRRSVCWARTAQ